MLNACRVAILAAGIPTDVGPGSPSTQYPVFNPRLATYRHLAIISMPSADRHAVSVSWPLLGATLGHDPSKARSRFE